MPDESMGSSNNVRKLRVGYVKIKLTSALDVRGAWFLEFRSTDGAVQPVLRDGAELLDCRRHHSFDGSWNSNYALLRQKAE